MEYKTSSFSSSASLFLLQWRLVLEVRYDYQAAHFVPFRNPRSTHCWGVSALVPRRLAFPEAAIHFRSGLGGVLGSIAATRLIDDLLYRKTKERGSIPDECWDVRLDTKTSTRCDGRWRSTTRSVVYAYQSVPKRKNSDVSWNWIANQVD